MFSFVARQPIFDTALNVIAYEILFRDGKSNGFPDIDPNEATSKIISSTHLGIGLDEITGGKTAFINFHRDTLIHRFPTSLDPSMVMIEILETVEVDETLIAACRHLREIGFELALDDFDADEKWRPLLPYVQVIKFDIRTIKEERILSLLPEISQYEIKLLAEKVETYAEFERFRELGFHYFQGYFLARPELVRHKQIIPAQMNMLALISACNQSPLDFDRINNIINKDASLTFLLLRFINNPFYNKRIKVKDLRHALNYLGENEVKKFVSLIALANLNNDSPRELLQLSLVRAKFCSLLVTGMNELNDSPASFLAGLLSLLDAMMLQPMSELLEKVPVSEEVKHALQGNPGMLSDCLLLAKHIESARWSTIKAFSKKYGIRQTTLHGMYNSSLKWAGAMENSIN